MTLDTSMLEEYGITRENLGDKYDQFVGNLTILVNAGVQNDTIQGVLEAAKNGMNEATTALTSALEGLDLPSGTEISQMARNFADNMRDLATDEDGWMQKTMAAFNEQDPAVKASAGAGVLALILGLFNGGEVKQSLTWGAVAAGVVGAGVWYMNKDKVQEPEVG